MGFSVETVQSNVRNTWHIREKENTWMCVALYCSSIRTSISPPPFGGRDTKGEHTLAKLVLVLCVGYHSNSWSRFLLFPVPELLLRPQMPACCRPRGCPVTHSGLPCACSGSFSQSMPSFSLSTCSCVQRQQQAEVFSEHI